MGAPPKGRETRRRGTRRLRRLWLSAAALATGLALVVLLAGGLERLRDTDLARPGADVTDASRVDLSADAPQLHFEEVAREAGVVFHHAPGPRRRLLPEDTGSGLAWGDYDGDGDPDLYAVNFPAGDPSDPRFHNRLFRNDGGSFTDVTAEAGVADPGGFGMGAYFADFDGDGDLDLYVTNYGPNRLYENRGDGTFREVAAAAGVDEPSWSTGAAWGDFDRDGRLDLYLVGYVDFPPSLLEARRAVPVAPASPGTAGGDPGPDPWQGVPFTLNPNAFDPVPNRLYRNLGDGTFEEVALPAGVSDPRGRGLAATFVDLDGDGWLDLYVNNDVSPNALFRNLGGDSLAGTFEDLSTRSGTADPRGSMGLAVLELDGTGAGAEADGLPDLFITHWVAQENAVYQALRTATGIEYRDRTRQLGLGEPSLDRVGWGCAATDLDLDGRPDLLVANGSTLEARAEPGRPFHLQAQPLFVLWNGGERFHDLAFRAGEVTGRRHDGRGLAAADYDMDGDVDFAVSVNRGRLLLLRNDSPAVRRRASLTVRLEGPEARVRGAKVELVGRSGRQLRWAGADVSFLSQHGPELVFGLGGGEGEEAWEPRRLRVRWADGRSSEVELEGGLEHGLEDGGGRRQAVRVVAPE